jgi:general secretion pathway protein D
MRRLFLLLASCWLICSSWAQSPDQSPPVCPTGAAQATCVISPEDEQKAAQAFQRGRKLRKKDPEQALEFFETAVRLDPRNLDYLSEREEFREQLIAQYLQRGDQLMRAQRSTEAAVVFRQALQIDPGNDTLRQRLIDALPAPNPEHQTWLQSDAGSSEVLLDLKPGQQSFHLATDTRGLYTAIARAFGVSVTFDESVPMRSARMDIDSASFFAAMDLAGQLTKTFWTPLSSTKILVAVDTPSKRKELERYVLRTFYLPEATSPQELNDIVNLLRTVFDIRLVTQSQASSTITVRAPAAMLDVVARFLDSMDAGRPQVMLQVDSFEITEQLMHDLGVNLPLQFNVFNIPASALTAVSSTDLQTLINQLIASGGINQANSTAISALLAQLQNQNQQNSLFSQPLATFGKGLTLFGIAISPGTAHFSLNESRVITLEHVDMRAAQGNAATFRLGTRYPILNATFAPIFNAPQIAQVIGNNSFVAAFPSFSYEDLGLTVKAKPLIHGNESVTLELEIELKTLTGQSFNGVPVIGNRSYKGVITVLNNEPAVVAGMVTKTENATLHGAPAIGRAPVLGLAFAEKNKEHDRSELIIVITPRILSAGPAGSRLIPLPQMQ